MPKKQDEPTWDPIPCEQCGKDIPFYDADGELRREWKYNQLMTCSPECYGRLQANKRRKREMEEYQPTAMDAFLGTPRV